MRAQTSRALSSHNLESGKLETLAFYDLMFGLEPTFQWHAICWEKHILSSSLRAESFLRQSQINILVIDAFNLNINAANKKHKIPTMDRKT